MLIDTGHLAAIKFATEGEVRSRRVVTYSKANSTGKYPGWKMGRMHEWESLAERHAFLVLDSDPCVLRFSEQPCEIKYWQSGILRRHFPDILVEYSDRKELWEVKTESDAAKADVKERTTLLSGSLPGWGYRYMVHTAEDLRGEPRLKNAEFLLNYGRKPVTLQQRDTLGHRLTSTGYLCWSDFETTALQKAARAQICRLALEGILTFDTSHVLHEGTHFTASRGGY